LLLAEVFATRTAADWLEALEAASIPCAPVRAMDEVFAAPEGAATIQEVQDPVRGLLRLVASPVHVDGARAQVRRPPPRLGEHTDEVLRELES
jgi:crotonobetainyl-CoA:carnitine CoA-transferase CaiB-like acyl-CoA transferase